MSKKVLNRKGFTIVEALIALSVFSFMLVLFSLIFIQINRLFVKGQTIKRMNETSRQVIEDISRSARLASADDVEILIDGVDGEVVNRLCLSSGIRYGWVLPSEGPSELVRSFDSAACSDPITESDGAVMVDTNSDGSLDGEIQTVGASSFLSENIEVRKFSVEQLIDDQGDEVGVLIDFILSSGDSELFEGLNEQDIESQACSGTLDSGRQFCDVGRYSTFVSYRN